MKNKKRLLCLCMAAALLLLPVRVLAEGSSAPEAQGNSSAAQGVPGLSGNAQEKPEEILQPEPEEEEAPVIRVTVPDTGRVILNPYGLNLTVGGRKTTEQVASSTYTLKNESEIPVTVWAKAVGTVPDRSEAVFVSEPPASDAEEKQAFVYAEFRPKDGEAGWLGSYVGEKNQLVVSEWGAQSTAVLTLPEGTDGEFRLFGSTNVPTSTMWTAKDRVDVSIAFSFTTADWWAEPEKSKPAIEDEKEEPSSEESSPPESPAPEPAPSNRPQVIKPQA